MQFTQDFTQEFSLQMLQIQTQKYPIDAEDVQFEEEQND